MHCEFCTLEAIAIHVMPMGKSYSEKKRKVTAYYRWAFAHRILYSHTFGAEAKHYSHFFVLLGMGLCFIILEKAVISAQFRVLYSCGIYRHTHTLPGLLSSTP